MLREGVSKDKSLTIRVKKNNTDGAKVVASLVITVE
jgi:hypothetical protein